MTRTVRKVEGTKPSNPKDLVGIKKLPLQLIPATALAQVALAHYDGLTKYGAWNWRNHGVRASIYLDAAERHIKAWQEGETLATDSQVHHLAHAICCFNIILDAEIAGKLMDDRPPSNPGYQTLIDTLTNTLAHLQAKNRQATPRHFTIADSDECREV